MAAQLTEAVTGKLKTSYKEPAQVTVIVNQSKSYALDVLGDMHAQGKHVVRLGTTFLQAVSLAGGFIAFASTRKITLRHRCSACKGTFIPMLYNGCAGWSASESCLKTG